MKTKVVHKWLIDWLSEPVYTCICMYDSIMNFRFVSIDYRKKKFEQNLNILVGFSFFLFFFWPKSNKAIKQKWYSSHLEICAERERNYFHTFIRQKLQLCYVSLESRIALTEMFLFYCYLDEILKIFFYSLNNRSRRTSLNTFTLSSNKHYSSNCNWKFENNNKSELIKQTQFFASSL